MPTLTIEYQTEAERLILERAIAYASGIRRLAVTAPHRTAPSWPCANNSPLPKAASSYAILWPPPSKHEPTPPTRKKLGRQT